MKVKARIIGLIAAALSILCIVALLAMYPFSSPSFPVSNNVMMYINIKNIDEYYTYITTETALPENFVTAEDLSVFGRFEHFQIDPTNLSVYSYDFITENGDHIDLYVDHDLSDNTRNTNKTLHISETDSSMLKLTTEDNGSIVRDGIEYRYIRGQLSSVRWTIDNIQFRILVNSAWSDYSTLQADSLLYKMLSVSESEFASALTQMNAIPTKNDHVTE